MNEVDKKRNFNLDIVRNLALFTLISVHFLLNNEFYNTEVIGTKMYIAFIFRSLFMICVPLFLILTGFLMNKKELNKKFYKGLIKILINYILAMVFVYVFKCFYNHNVFSIPKLISYILSFKDSAWYINMYIGLFLLIPFLNIIYSNLKNKRQKQFLILTLLALTTLPSILNIYDFRTLNCFFSSKSVEGYNVIVPNWWVQIYPITYYFIGAYLSEYKINIEKVKNIILIFIVLILSATFNYIRSYGRTFEWAIYNDWGSLENILSSSLIFIFILNLNFQKIRKGLRTVISKISDLSYVAYLVSQVFELILYTFLDNNCSGFYQKSVYYITSVLLIFIVSLVTSYIISIIYKIILIIIEKIKVYLSKTKGGIYEQL